MKSLDMDIKKIQWINKSGFSVGNSESIKKCHGCWVNSNENASIEFQSTCNNVYLIGAYWIENLES